MMKPVVVLVVFLLLSVVHCARIKPKRSVKGFVLEGRPSTNKNKKDPPSTDNKDTDIVRSGSKPGSNTKDRSNGDKSTEPFVNTGNINPNQEKEKGENGKNSGIGNFWHLSDLHLDYLYNQHATDPRKVCPSSNGVAVQSPGPYGDYHCDSPWKLVSASIHAMREKYRSPDFILWTGDDTLHTDDEERYLSTEIVLETIKNVTKLLKEVFPSTTIVPALGNHDYHPKNQMPVGPSPLLRGIADLWEEWIGEMEKEVFADGGYYVSTNSKAPSLQTVVLNTNLWYSSNRLINTTFDEDPGGQFEFLRSVLDRAVHDNMMVYIVGHIPPGYFELVDYKRWLYEQYNLEYIKIIQEYSHVIAGQFFGHHHTDSFRVFNHEGRSVSTAWIAPGVSPWKTNLPGVSDGANNPGIRLYQYDRDTLRPTNYVQYYMDLEKANSDGSNEWIEEYTAKEMYGEDISTLGMENLYKKLRDADPNCENCEDNILLQKFALHNSVSYNRNHCDRRCQKLHTCAIGELDQTSYIRCINSASSLSVARMWVYVAVALLITKTWN